MLDFTKTWQRLIRINWAILAMLVAAALVIPNSAAAVTLSSALAFSALSTSGDVNINNVAKVSVNALGAVGGQNVTLGSNSLAGGDAVADPGAITLGNFSKVISKCITGGGAVNLNQSVQTTSCHKRRARRRSKKIAIIMTHPRSISERSRQPQAGPWRWKGSWLSVTCSTSRSFSLGWCSILGADDLAPSSSVRPIRSPRHHPP